MIDADLALHARRRPARPGTRNGLAPPAAVKGVLELRHLRAFVAVAEAEHVTRAAAQLRIAQPALSRQIQQLEQAVGVALLARVGRGVRLTAAGRAFLDDTRTPLAHADLAVSRARHVGRGTGGLLRIGFVEVASASRLVPEAVRRFAVTHPDVAVDLRELSSTRQVATLRARELDIGFVCAKTVGRADGLTAVTMLVDPVVAVLSRCHPLADSRRVALRALAGQPLLLVRRELGPALHGDVLAALAGAGIVVDRVQEVSQWQTIVQMAAAGVGIGLVPRSAAAAVPADGVVRPIVGLGLRHRTDLVRRAGEPDALVTAFSDLCRIVARELGGRVPPT